MSAQANRAKLFISHKAAAGETAAKIRGVIDERSKNIEIWTSALIEKGAQWRPSIVKALEESTDLVLLFTDPAENWDWCLYETGFFDALVSHRGDTRGVVVIHHEAVEVPDPLQANQTVPARVEEIEKWLTKLFQKETDEYRRKVPEAAALIAQMFENMQSNIFSASSMTITVPVCADLLKTPDDQLPNNTVVRAPKEFLAEVAKHAGNQVTWPVLSQKLLRDPNLHRANSIWLKEISRTIHRLAMRDAPALQSVLVAETNRYRAVLERADITASGMLECKLLLVDDVGGPTRGLDEARALCSRASAWQCGSGWR